MQLYPYDGKADVAVASFQPFRRPLDNPAAKECIREANGDSTTDDGGYPPVEDEQRRKGERDGEGRVFRCAVVANPATGSDPFAPHVVVHRTVDRIVPRVQFGAITDDVADGVDPRDRNERCEPHCERARNSQGDDSQ